MAKHEIELGANFTSVTKGFEELKKNIDGLSKKKFGINLDKKVFTQMAEAGKKAFKELQAENEILTRKANALSKALDHVADPQRFVRLREKLRGVFDDMNKNVSTMSDPRSRSSGMFGGLGNRIAGGLGGGAGMGRAIGALGSVGMIASAIYAGFKMAMAPLGPAIRAADDRMTLKGFGLSSGGIKSMEMQGRMMGFSGEESRKHALSMMSATGGLGGMAGMQLLSRGSGIGMEDLIGMAGGFRQSGLSGGESLKVLKEIYTDSVAAGFDGSRVGEVMRTISQKSALLSATGTFDADSVRGMVSSIMQSSSFFAQNASRSMNVAESFSNAFETKGPMQGLAVRSIYGMSSQNGRELTPTEALFEARQGLFRKSLIGMNSSQKTQGFMQTMLSEMFGKDIKPGSGSDNLDPLQLLRASMAMGDATGIKQDTALELIMGYLDKSDKDRDQFIGDKMDAEERLQRNTVEILTSTEMEIKLISTFVQEIKEILSTAFAEKLMGSNFIDRMRGISAERSKILDQQRALNYNDSAWYDVFGMSGNDTFQSKFSKGGGKFSNSGKLSLKEGANKYEALIDMYAKKYDVDPSLIGGLINQESGWDPNAKSPTGAFGLGQFTQSTWEYMRKSAPHLPASKWDATEEEQIEAIAAHMAQLQKTKKTKDPGTLVSSYIDPKDISWHVPNVLAAQEEYKKLTSGNDYITDSVVPSVGDIGSKIGSQIMTAPTEGDTIVDNFLGGTTSKKKKVVNEPLIESSLTDLSSYSLNKTGLV